MRLFGSTERRFALDAEAAARIFKREFNRALDSLEQERELSTLPDYEYGNLNLFMDVHEEVYRYLAETNSYREIGWDEWIARVPHLDEETAELSYQEIKAIGCLWYEHLDEVAALLESEQIETEIFFMDHAKRLRFEARLAAVQEYRRQLQDPSLRLKQFLSVPVNNGAATTSHRQVEAPRIAEPTTGSVALTDASWSKLTAQATATKFIEENPKLLGSASGKRGAKWTPKTRSQFETAMRLLQKSMGEKPFVELSNEDLRQLLRHFDGLPPNHHKSPRHGPMSLAEICEEAQEEVRAGTLDPAMLGLNVPTLNRHFRFIRMAHDWVRREVSTVSLLDWSAFSFDDSRNAREQREPFPISTAIAVFSLPPWHGSADKRRRFKNGEKVFHDSLYWVLPIIWYSGMRRQEACKLRVADVITSDEGIVYFDIDDTDSGRVKTTTSRRQIPVADELLRLGLVEFVEAKKQTGSSLLFPELLSETRNMGDSYYRLCWNKIIVALDEKPEGLTIHGIRHTVADELKAAEISEEVRADLLGHALQSETAGRYSKASRLSILKDAVNKIPIVTSGVARSPLRLVD